MVMSELHVTILAAIVSIGLTGGITLWVRHKDGKARIGIVGTLVTAVVVFILAGVAISNAADRAATRCDNGVETDCGGMSW
jgi:high-affinity Fe2+/Pb2+ permease